MRFVLIDHPAVHHRLHPLTLSRSIADLRVGILTLRDKWQRHLGETHVEVQTLEYLQCLYKEKKEKKNTLEEDTTYICSHIIPNEEIVEEIKKLKPRQKLIAYQTQKASSPPLEIAYVKAKDNDSEQAKGFKTIELSYQTSFNSIDKLLSLYKLNAAEIENDLNFVGEGTTKHRKDFGTNKVITDPQAEHAVYLHPAAKVSHAILNITKGSIYIGEEAEIMEGSVVRGSTAICEHAVIKVGAIIYEGTTIGPYCKVGGEVSNTIFIGYSNKAHEGFIGNSVIGEWCNFGSGSTISNLKSNYSSIKLKNHKDEPPWDTGETFCGLFTGDYNSVGIMSQIYCGTTLGYCNLIAMHRPFSPHVPSFRWMTSDKNQGYNMESALRFVEMIRKRRDKNFDADHRAVFDFLYRTHYFS